MDQPAWLQASWAEFGVRELPGSADASAVMKYFREAEHSEIAHDATPWCAAFVGAMLKRSGYEGTGSLLARSYLSWGEAIDERRAGAVVVLSRGDDPHAGHVGLFVGAANDRVFLLGGNQGDAVSVEAFEASRVLGYRWPSSARIGPQIETLPPGIVRGIFEQALAHVLEMEGGYSDDPYDPGGPTNKGITLSDFAKWRGVTVTALSRGALIESLKDIAGETVADIYRARYWQPASCGLLPDAVALMHFDAAVNHGVGGATRLLQAALGAAVDGEIGPETLAAARSQSERTIVERYAGLRRARYRALPHFWRFGRGWMRRVDATETLALSLASDVAGDAAGTEKIKDETAKGTTNMSDDFKFPLPGDVPGHDATMPGGQVGGKWWPQSKTVWGTLITLVTTVLPVLGPLIGINISADMIALLGDQAVVVIQALGGLLGTLLALYGRSQATGPLTRSDVKVRV
jgi:uncharacterized protein (TIGR02594 family)